MNARGCGIPLGYRDNTMRMDALSGLILTWVSIIGVGAQQPAVR
jgi:hypothetical protein